MRDDIEDVVISSDMIRLGQLLKYTGIAESGAQAGALVAGGDVRVNGEPEARRGRQLVCGDLVEVVIATGTSRFRIV